MQPDDDTKATLYVTGYEEAEEEHSHPLLSSQTNHKRLRDLTE